jgi:hypothetical protein
MTTRSPVRRPSAAICAIVLVAALFSTFPARAQFHNTCALGGPISSGSTPFSTIGMTTDGAPHASCNFFGISQIYRDIWATYVAPGTGDVTIDICNSTFDTKLAIYGGAGCPVAPLYCIDDVCGASGLRSRITIPVTYGQILKIRIGAFNDNPNSSGTTAGVGTGTCVISCSCVPPPPNNNCSSATAIGNGTFSGTTIGATNDGTASCGSSLTSPDVWYSYTTSAAGILYVDTCSTTSGFDSVVSVHTGCPGTTANQFECDDDGCGHPYSSLNVSVAGAGQTYRIRVAGYQGATGAFTLRTSFVLPPPINDACANATSIGNGTFTGTTASATNDGSTTCVNSSSSPDVWFRYSAPCAGTAYIDSCGSGYDTVLSVHLGCPGTAANAIACNDDDCFCGGSPCRQSRIAVPVMAGEPLLIRVSGYNGAAGPFTLHTSCSATPIFGTTIITHGFQLFSPSKPGWEREMGEAIVTRAGRGGVYRYQPGTGAWTFVSGNASSSERVLLFNWAAESDIAGPGYAPAAADALYAALRRPNGDLTGTNLLANGVHFIGHSRGTVVNSEVVRRIAVAVPALPRVTQVTTLDAHPWSGASDPDPRTWTNVDWADNYFQEDLFSPNGLPSIGGAYTYPSLASLAGMNHSGVHEWYHGTINLFAVPSPFTRPTWYGGTVAGWDRGFYWSRIAGGYPGPDVEPSPSTPTAPDSIINGGFQEWNSATDFAGWGYHGGNGAGQIAQEGTSGNYVLLLDSSGTSRRHNRLFVPANAGIVSFRMAVISSATNTSLWVQLGNSLSIFPTSSTSGWVWRQASVPATFGETVQTLEFLVTSSAGTPSVVIDDITFAPCSSPTAPTSVVPDRNNFCTNDPGTISLSANGGSGTTLQWFSGSCGGTSIGTGNPLVIDSPTQTTQYFARWETSSCGSSGCANTTVIVQPVPTAPSSVMPDRNNFCSNDPGTISLSANGGSGTTLRWFSGSCGGTSIGTGNPLVIDSPTQTTQYFARWETSSCGSSGCANTTVTVQPTPTSPTSVVPDRNNFCSNDPGTITLTANGGSGTTLQWFSGSCGGTSIGTGNPLVIDSPTQTTQYFARWETSSCGNSSCANSTVSVIQCSSIVFVNAASGGGNGQAWNSAYRSLQDALDYARANPAVTEIWVARGVYKANDTAAHPNGRLESFTLVSGVAIFGGFVGGEASLSQRPAIPLCAGLLPPPAPPDPAQFSVLEGDLGNNNVVDRLVNRGDDTNNIVVVGNATGARLDGFVVRSGWTASAPNRGAGLLNESGQNVTVANCIFERNDATDGGGAVYSTGNPTFDHCVFRDSSVLLLGGTMLLEGPGAPTFLNCLFNGSYSHKDGGILAVQNGSSPNIVNCTFFGGWVNGSDPAFPGGRGAAIFIADANSHVRLDNCVVWGNGSSVLGTGEAAQFGPIPPDLLSRCAVQGWTGTLTGSGSHGGDPLFVDPIGFPVIGTHGVVARNLNLKGNSSCIDVGDNAATTQWNITTHLCTPGVRRLDDTGRCDAPGQISPVVDMGCFEFTGTSCYANCDASTVAPVLTANDFICFINRFATADPYANCDCSTANPTLTANDFICFLNRFAAGCP